LTGSVGSCDIGGKCSHLPGGDARVRIMGGQKYALFGKSAYLQVRDLVLERFLRISADSRVQKYALIPTSVVWAFITGFAYE
jgi:hypothetical protein